MLDHFTHAPAVMVPVGDFLAHAVEWTGCRCEDAIALLEGYSPYSVETVAELDAVAGAIAKDDEARRILESATDEGTGAEALAALRSRPGTGEAVDAWLDRVGQRIVTGHDVAARRFCEMPDLLLRTLRTHLRRPPAKDRRAAADEATRRLLKRTPAEHRRALELLLEEARLVYPMRDAHSVIDFWVMGVARGGLVEAGRRLHARGLLHDPEHVVDLVHDEIASLLLHGEGPSAGEVAEHALWRTTHTMADAPPLLGPPPGEPPPPEWLPPAAGRIARAAGVYMAKMFTDTEAPRSAETVCGVGASPGTYTGTARLVLSSDDFDKVQEGDVLIARITTPTYNVLLPLLGAVVTDRGGLLSHPAIVSREYGIPGVVGARDATARIPDGARVQVDGGAGTVTVLA